MRLLCFGDSFTATAGIPAEDIASGRPPSWIDLLGQRWGCESSAWGANGTGPLELLDQLANFGEFLPGDRVFCAFSRVTRFCITPRTPTIHHYTGIVQDLRHEHFNSRSRELDTDPLTLTATGLSRIIQAHRWYELFLNNEYRERALHRAVFTALDGIAGANPQAKFYVKYCFVREWELYRVMNLQSKFFKLLDGDMFSICGEAAGKDITNHFTVDSVGDFVNYLDGVMV